MSRDETEPTEIGSDLIDAFLAETDRAAAYRLAQEIDALCCGRYTKSTVLVGLSMMLGVAHRAMVGDAAGEELSMKEGTIVGVVLQTMMQTSHDSCPPGVHVTHAAPSLPQ